MEEMYGMISELLKTQPITDFNVEELRDKFRNMVTPEELEYFRKRDERNEVLANTVGTKQWMYKQMCNEVEEIERQHPFDNQERKNAIDAVEAKWNDIMDGKVPLDK